MKDYLYFDHAAATPVDSRVLEAMLPYFSEQFYNPSALYGPAVAVANAVAAARATVGQLIGAHPSEVVFTAGGTEANNLAIRGVMEHFPGKKMATLAIEHDSVLGPASLYDSTIVPVGEDGRAKLAAIKDAVTDDTVLVSVQYGGNEIGTVQPLSDIGQFIKEARQARREAGNDTPLYLHTDACQVPLYLDVHVARLGVDLLTLNGGKIYGPKQSGVLYVARGVELAPLILGGGQERAIRSGTENVPAIIGFARALDLAQAGRKAESSRLSKLRDDCMQELEAKVPGLEITGSKRFRLPNNVHVTIDGTDNERLLFELDQRGILAAAGSACSASSEEPSHVLKALGFTDAKARGSLRFTFGHATNKSAIDTLIKTLADLTTNN
jgi:cysteine desulfurase